MPKKSASLPEGQDGMPGTSSLSATRKASKRTQADDGADGAASSATKQKASRKNGEAGAAGATRSVTKPNPSTKRPAAAAGRIIMQFPDDSNGYTTLDVKDLGSSCHILDVAQSISATFCSKPLTSNESFRSAVQTLPILAVLQSFSGNQAKRKVNVLSRGDPAQVWVEVNPWEKSKLRQVWVHSYISSFNHDNMVFFILVVHDEGRKGIACFTLDDEALLNKARSAGLQDSIKQALQVVMDNAPQPNEVCLNNTSPFLGLIFHDANSAIVNAWLKLEYTNRMYEAFDRNLVATLQWVLKLSLQDISTLWLRKPASSPPVSTNSSNFNGERFSQESVLRLNLPKIAPHGCAQTDVRTSSISSCSNSSEFQVSHKPFAKRQKEDFSWLREEISMRRNAGLSTPHCLVYPSDPNSLSIRCQGLRDRLSFLGPGGPTSNAPLPEQRGLISSGYESMARVSSSSAANWENSRHHLMPQAGAVGSETFPFQIHPNPLLSMHAGYHGDDTLDSPRLACNGQGSLFAEPLSRITSSSASWDNLGHQQQVAVGDAATFDCSTTVTFQAQLHPGRFVPPDDNVEDSIDLEAIDLEPVHLDAPPVEQCDQDSPTGEFSRGSECSSVLERSHPQILNPTTFSLPRLLPLFDDLGDDYPNNKETLFQIGSAWIEPDAEMLFQGYHPRSDVSYARTLKNDADSLFGSELPGLLDL